MLNWINNTLDALGYPGIVLFMFLENVFPLIPSEAIMPFAGFMTAQGRFSFLGVIAAGMFGSVLGNLPLYYLGKFVGEERLKRWADQYGKWVGLTHRDIDKAKDWFDRHGSKTVFLCRLVPGIRSIISIPAGFADMRLSTFLFYSALGTGLWGTILAYLGRVLGKNYKQVEQYMSLAGYIVLAIIVVICIRWIMKHKKEGLQR
ncbi:MAG TPA: DedA family protein [Thermodesulfobacteriota bacterium]|nr:DedA family protein [Thermodesulfobacteriota bacterium]